MLERKRAELKTIYDTRKSFYGKAEFEEITTKGGAENIKILYSYKTPVFAIVEDASGYKWKLYNEKIRKGLLFSQTTLRHIKEFLKQFNKNEEITKKDILKTSEKKPFDYILLKETNEGNKLELASERNFELTTSPETRRFFKSFEGYRESKKTDKEGIHIFTRSNFGFSNYHFIIIK